MKLTKEQIKTIAIIALFGFAVIANISAGSSANIARNEAKENIKLQTELGKIQNDPITIYTQRVRGLNEEIEILEEQVKELQWKRDVKFCTEIQLNRVVNFEEVVDGYCDIQENIDELKKL